MKYSKLFEPINIGKLRLKNRIAMAPMGNVGYSNALGSMNPRIQDYYVERAKNDVGLIITGICDVDMTIEGLPTGSMPCPTTNPITFIHAGNEMNDRIHAYGTKSIIQLTAGLGRSALPGFTKNNIAPSENGNRFNPNVMHRAMTKEEIGHMIKQFVTASVVSKQAGFDGVEIHAVHEGYLLDQFAISLFNKRDDEYGGSLENRLRLATDIVKGIKAACGKDFPVTLRYSLKSCMKALRQGGLPGEEYTEVGRDIPEGIEAAKILVAAGYDALDVDAGTYDAWYWSHPPMYFEDGMYREFGEILKKEVDVPIILAGRMENPEMGNEAIGKSCDIVAFGRALLADPEVATKIKEDRFEEVRPCLGCHEGCLGRISKAPVCCAVNPQCGRENTYGLTKALEPKNILVIGGGLAGMEVARVSTIRGHKVTLVEKTNELGGNLIVGSVPHFKRHDRELIEYYKKQLQLLNIEVKMNTEITKDNIDGYNADLVIVATGSTPRTLDVDGTKAVYTADQILLGKVDLGENIVIIGGGLVGCETGLWLAQQGKKVNVVEIASEAFPGLPHMNHFMLEDLLNYHKVDIHLNSTVVKSTDKEVIVKTKDGEITLPCDTLVSSVGYKENNKLFKELDALRNKVYNIGDSNKVHNIMYSIWDAYELARNL